jgi:glycosyltransferase involved in cell wall biosynthesis
MKICYITGYYYTSNDGIGRYTNNLIQEIKRIDKKDKIEIVSDGKRSSSSAKRTTPVPGRKPLFPPFVHKLMKPAIMEYNYFKRFMKTKTDWPRQVRNFEADIFHAVSPSEAVPAVIENKKPLVTTFHDIIPLIFQPRYIFERIYFKHYSEIAKRSQMIIADSKQTKQDLISVLSIPKEKISVVYPGIDLKTFSPKAKKDKKDKIILYQGGLVERKGPFQVVEAFGKLLTKRKDIRLRIGGGGDEAFALRQEVKKLGIEEYVEFLGFVPDNDLAKQYHEADVFVYPSRYEGFGYTPLEAMACGTPVITSNTSSIPEVVADAAITVDPLDTEAIGLEIDSQTI